MAIDLRNKPNVQTTSTYPLGTIKDNTGSNDGTPVNRLVYHDLHYFFASLMSITGTAYSNVLDSGSLSQYLLALIKMVRLTSATEADAGTAEIATQAEANGGTDDSRMITPLKLFGVWGSWVDNDLSKWSVTINTNVTASNFVCRIKKVNKTVHLRIGVDLTLSAGAGFGQITLLAATGNTLLGTSPYQIHSPVYTDAADVTLSYIHITSAPAIRLRVTNATNSLPNGTYSVEAHLTFELQ